MSNFEKRFVARRKNWQRILLLLLSDVIVFSVSSLFALLVSFEFSLGALQNSSFFYRYLAFMPLFALISLPIFAVFRLYSSLWQYAGVDEFFRIICASILAVAVQFILMNHMGMSVPLSHPVLHLLTLTLLMTAMRYFFRFVRSVKHRYIDKGLVRTMLIGGGSAGIMAMSAFSSSARPTNKVVCIIDDDPNKLGTYINGVKVVGGRDTILENVASHKIKEIVYAIPSASAEAKRDILQICQNARTCVLKILPEIYAYDKKNVNASGIRRVSIEDVLSRPEIKVDLNDISGYISDKTVLVTGGGGSIGSELCRQIARYKPSRLIIFDISENGTYAIQQELLWAYPEIKLLALIGSVRDRVKVDAMFEKYKPDIVFHAAAHKHVPLMEVSPCEAVKNNVFGTLNVAESAIKHGTKRFLLVSTDKAVNPTSIMGATKLMCEEIIGAFAGSTTEFVAVRFGNVLGSSGSVVPLFRNQIEHGGPVTVTHPEITRFFMTIPEAVSLILQAGSYARGGEIFVLNMGEPVKIDDLARNMIRLSGYEPGVDMEIKYTGLRPGEKLYEEPLMDNEHLVRTPNELIYIEHQPSMTRAALDDMLNDLWSLASSGNADKLVEYMHKSLPTFILKQ